MQITHNDKIYAIFIDAASAKDGLSFYSDDRDFIQVGTWRYPANKELLAHNHKFASRSIDRTQEFIYVVNGELEATIYDESDNVIKQLTLRDNQGLVLLAGGHGYKIRKDDTLVIEVKNGPYLGANEDRRRLNS